MKKENEDVLKNLIKWIQPELDEMFPEPGSFSGLMLMFPGLWIEIMKLKFKKLWRKKK